MAPAKEKYKPNILTESIFSMHRVFPSTLNRTGTWVLVDLPLKMLSEKHEYNHLKPKCSQYLLWK